MLSDSEGIALASSLPKFLNTASWYFSVRYFTLQPPLYRINKAPKQLLSDAQGKKYFRVEAAHATAWISQ